MVQSFGIEVPSIADAAVDAGLARLAEPAAWLLSIEDKVRLRADLEHSIPELADGSLRLAKAKFKRAHIQDGTYVSLCRLTLEDPDGGSAHDVDLHGVLVLPWADPPADATTSVGLETLDGWRGYLPDLRWEISLEPHDAALPAMPSLTDPEPARTLLEDALRASGGDLADVRIARCTPTVMRYREGRRCTIRYEVEYADGAPEHWPTGMIAKVYDGPDEARHTYDVMTALWSSPLSDSTTVRIARPLAHVPEQHVLVQGLVPGERPLKDLIKKKAFEDGLDAGVGMLTPFVRRAGRALGELHTSGAVTGEVVTWEQQLDAVRAAAADLGSAVPTLVGASDPLVADLEALRATMTPGPLVPTHRSFRPAQLLVDGDGLSLIDFDGACMAEPGLDLALFRATLCDLSLRALEDDGPLPAAEQEACQVRLDELCGTFLDGYREVAEYSEERLALWDVLTSAKDVLDVWRKIKFEHLERRMRFLRHKLGT